MPKLAREEVAFVRELQSEYLAGQSALPSQEAVWAELNTFFEGRYSQTQLMSTAAWVKIYAKKIIDAFQLPCSIETFIKLSADKPETIRKERLSEIAQTLSISEDLAKECICLYHSLLEAKDSHSSPDLSSVPLPDLAGTEPPTEPTGSFQFQTSGEHFDYTFGVKQIWREKWTHFLEKHLAELSPQQISKLKVLCLPSKNPATELRIYLELGIKPENIYAVEGGEQSARDCFNANMREFPGVNAITDRLENFLHGPRQYDIVNLDFHSNISNPVMTVLSYVNTSDNCLLIVNRLAGREGEDAQKTLRELEQYHRKCGFFVQSTPQQHIESVTKHHYASFEEFEADSSRLALSETRSGASDLAIYQEVSILSAGVWHKSLMASLIGVGSHAITFMPHWNKHLEHDPEDPQVVYDLKLIAGTEFFLQYLYEMDGMAMQLYQPGMPNIRGLTCLNAAADMIIKRRPYVTDIEKYRYTSESTGKSHASMQSVFLKLERPDYVRLAERMSLPDLCNFAIIAAKIKAQEGDSGRKPTYQYTSRGHLATTISKKTRLEMRSPDGSQKAFIRLSDFTQAFKIASQIYENRERSKQLIYDSPLETLTL